MERLRIGGSAALLLCTLLGGGVGRPVAAQAAPPEAAPLEIRFLDVGQGDAILIRAGHLGVLVDAGGADDIVRVLAEEGIDSLVAAIASHNHDDHIGGMDAVLADYPVGRYYANGREPANANAESVEAWLDERKVVRAGTPWEPFSLGGARITVFPSLLDPDDASENNSSLGVLIEQGSFRALLTGDSETEEIQAWLTAGAIPRVTLLKAAHHGARNGLTPGWLDRTRPEVVVISVGAGNTYGHPSPWAMRYYLAGHRRVLRTDRDGTVVVAVAPSGSYTIETTRPVER